MLALSLSMVISDCSARIVSPTCTKTSITATSLKSPILGTRSSMACVCAAATGLASGEDAGVDEAVGATEAGAAGAALAA